MLDMTQKKKEWLTTVGLILAWNVSLAWSSPGTPGEWDFETLHGKVIESIATRHPMDPLSSAEMRFAASIVRKYSGNSRWQFKFIGLQEPDKVAIYPYFLTQTIPPIGLIPLRANVLIADPIKRTPIWVVVNLSAIKVESWNESPNERVAAITIDDMALASKIALNDAAVIARLKALGYTDLSKVMPEVWPSGYVQDKPNYNTAAKLVQIYFYGLPQNGSNFYAHPMDFIAVIALGSNKVLGLENLPIHKGFDTTDRRGNSVPKADANIFPDLLPPGTIRQDGLRPLQISQPGGPSFRISGREISWQNFKLRLGYNPREGAYFYTVTFNDHGEIRPIAYRMSMSEVYLLYGDPRPPYHRKASIDESTFEFGSSARALPVHQFCRGEAYYYDVDHHNENADTWVTQNSICVREEDEDILWAHYDPVSTRTAVTRSQRLAISTLVSIEFTDYWITWRFYQDATIELAIRITGHLSTNLMAPDVKDPLNGVLVMPQVVTQFYQHFFAVRLDLDVDGMDNTVSTEDVVRTSETLSASNPYGNGMAVDSTILKTPAQAATDNKPARAWKISNPNKIQYLSGLPVAWKLFAVTVNPQQTSMLTPDSPIRSTVPWTDHNMWVTPYDPNQIFAGGRYQEDGVAYWTNKNASTNIENKDVVLWHVLSYVHAPEIEDFPVLSGCHTTVGFRLRPSGFFNENVAISVPPASETTAMDGTCDGSYVSVTQTGAEAGSLSVNSR